MFSCNIKESKNDNTSINEEQVTVEDSSSKDYKTLIIGKWKYTKMIVRDTEMPLPEDMETFLIF